MSNLSITVLGCSGSYAAAGQACSGYLVRTDDTTIWVDCGPGTLANLQEQWQLSDLDAIVVSHHHPDHCAELPLVYNAAKYYCHMDALSVICTEGVRRVTDAFHPDNDSSDFFEWQIVSDRSTVSVGDIDITFSQTDHPVETLAMRFDHEDDSILYTSDTGRDWSLSALGTGRGANPNVVIGEGTLLEATDSPEIPHVSCTWLAREANAIGAAHLVVTHVPPGSNPTDHGREAAEVFDGPVTVAHTGAKFPI